VKRWHRAGFTHDEQANKHLRNRLHGLKSGICLFPKFIFQAFLCLFVIRKVSQQKTLSGQ